MTRILANFLRSQWVLAALFSFAVAPPLALASPPDTTAQESEQHRLFCSSLDPQLVLAFEKSQRERDLRQFNESTLYRLADQFLASFTIEERVKIATNGAEANDELIRKKVAALSAGNKMQWKVCDEDSLYIQRQEKFADGNSMILCANKKNVKSFDPQEDKITVITGPGYWGTKKTSLQSVELFDGDYSDLETDSDSHTLKGQTIRYGYGYLTLTRFDPDKVTLTVRVGKELAEGRPKGDFLSLSREYVYAADRQSDLARSKAQVQARLKLGSSSPEEINQMINRYSTHKPVASSDLVSATESRAEYLDRRRAEFGCKDLSSGESSSNSQPDDHERSHSDKREGSKGAITPQEAGKTHSSAGSASGN